MALEAVRQSLEGIAAELRGIEGRIAALAEILPDSPDREAMLEGEAPYDPATEILVTVQTVLGEGLLGYIASQLVAAAQASPEALAERHRQCEARLRRAWRTVLDEP